jgi:hypothetical protein
VKEYRKENNHFVPGGGGGEVVFTDDSGGGRRTEHNWYSRGLIAGMTSIASMATEWGNIFFFLLGI